MIIGTSSCREGEGQPRQWIAAALRAAVTGLGLLVSLGTGAARADDSDTHWRVSAGPMWRTVERVRFQTGSHIAPGSVPWSVEPGISGARAAAGPSDEAADRTYSDGFVNTDFGTPLDGDTWCWGYANASQVQGGRLVLTADDGELATIDRRTSHVAVNTIDRHEDGGGFLLEAAYLANPGERVTFGTQINCAYTRFAIGGTASTFSGVQRWTRSALSIRDSYDLMGVVPPPAPYAGTREGPGPVIPNTPVVRQHLERQIASGRAEVHNAIAESLDLHLATLSVGGLAEARCRRLRLTVAAGPSVSLVQTVAHRDETLLGSDAGTSAAILREWQDHEEADRIRTGLFVQTGVGVALSARWQAAVVGRYDWINDIAGEVGPSPYYVDPDGGSVSGTIGFTF